MLTPFDDHPIHQTPSPIAQPASSDPNQYDRYFFNGHDADGELFFAAAMGHYPNRGVVDAAFCVVHDGVQHSVFASGLISPERATTIGPLRVEVVEGLRTLRVVVSTRTTLAWWPTWFSRLAHRRCRNRAKPSPATTACSWTTRG